MLALIADTSISGRRVARELDALIRLCGEPISVIVDNGTELTSRAMLESQNDTAGITSRPESRRKRRFTDLLKRSRSGVLKVGFRQRNAGYA